MQIYTKFWNLFSSVQLAIITLCLLAFSSIFGTIIPQNKSLDWYEHYFSSISIFGNQIGDDLGFKIALICDVLDIPDMYSSWWFQLLLTILAINLIICSLHRFPSVWKQITADNLSVSDGKLKSFKHKQLFKYENLTIPEIIKLSEKSLNSFRLKIRSKQGEANLISAQKGAYSRTGVYIVHLSIIVIFVGAIVGNIFGFKGSISIPEQRQVDFIFSSEDSSKIPLDFTIRCNFFDIEYYETGMAKEYTSSLTVFEGQKEILTTDIEVNKPLTYKGVTFYQANYEPFQDFVISILDTEDKTSKTFVASFQQPVQWEEKGITVGITKAQILDQRFVKLKLFAASSGDTPVEKTIDPGQQIEIEQGGKKYLIRAKQKYATGLQVSKDPGIWIVYLGCFLMISGLYIAFFLSHKRVWVSIKKQSQDLHTVSVYGSTNKNVTGFESYFEDVCQHLDETIKKR